MAFEREIGRVDLRQRPWLTNATYSTCNGTERVEVIRKRVVVLIAHRGRQNAGRRCAHERLDEGVVEFPRKHILEDAAFVVHGPRQSIGSRTAPIAFGVEPAQRRNLGLAGMLPVHIRRNPDSGRCRRVTAVANLPPRPDRRALSGQKNMSAAVLWLPTAIVLAQKTLWKSRASASRPGRSISAFSTLSAARLPQGVKRVGSTSAAAVLPVSGASGDVPMGRAASAITCQPDTGRIAAAAELMPTLYPAAATAKRRSASRECAAPPGATTSAR